MMFSPLTVQPLIAHKLRDIPSSVVLAVIGFACLIAWQETPLFLGEGFFVALHAALASTLLAYAIALRARPDAAHRPVTATCAVTAILMCTCPLTAFFLPDPSAPARIALGAICGCAMGTALRSWLDVFTAMKMTVAVPCVLCSYSAAAIVRLTPGWEHASQALFVGLVLSAAVSMALLRLLEIGGRVEPDPATGHAMSSAMPHRCNGPAAIQGPSAGASGATVQGNAWSFSILVAYCACGLAFGFMRVRITEISGGMSMLAAGPWLRAAFPLLILGAVLIARRRPNTASALATALLLMLVSAFAAILLPQALPGIVPTITELARYSMAAMLLCVILLRQRSIAKDGVACAWLCAYELLHTLGLMLWSMPFLEVVHSASPSIAKLIAVSMLAILLVGCIQVVNVVANETLSQTLLAHGHESPRFRTDDTVSARCAAVGKTFGLTPREVQILELICTGRSKRHTAEVLGVSEETVRWHTRQLYAKLGVHNKQDAISIVGLQ